jgi:hypothetical protein
MSSRQRSALFWHKDKRGVETRIHGSRIQNLKGTAAPRAVSGDQEIIVRQTPAGWPVCCGQQFILDE